MFDVIETSSTGKQIECDIENVIGLIVGQMKLQHVGRSIEFFSEIECFDQLDNRREAAARDGVLLLGELEPSLSPVGSWEIANFPCSTEMRRK